MMFEATVMVSCCIPYDEEKEKWKMFASKDLDRHFLTPLKVQKTDSPSPPL